MAFFAAEFWSFPLGGGGDFASDVTAEQVAHSFALPQAVDHRVEATLQLAELCSVEDHQIASQVALFDPLERRAHHPHRRRRQPGQDPHQDESEDQRCGSQ